MSLRDNPLLKKMIATGEERMSKVAANLLTNEKLMGVVQKTFSAALDVKGIVEKNVQTALSTLNVPTASDVKKLEGKIEELEKVFESLSILFAQKSTAEADSPTLTVIPTALMATRPVYSSFIPTWPCSTGPRATILLPRARPPADPNSAPKPKRKMWRIRLPICFSPPQASAMKAKRSPNNCPACKKLLKP